MADIRHAVSSVAAQHGVDFETRSRIELAVSEAATNAVLHAYRSAGASGRIHVLAIADDAGFLDVVVSDQGIGMSARRTSPGMGAGLSLMAHEADRLEIGAGQDGGTEVRMRFVLPSDPSESAAA